MGIRLPVALENLRGDGTMCKGAPPVSSEVGGSDLEPVVKEKPLRGPQSSQWCCPAPREPFLIDHSTQVQVLKEEHVPALGDSEGCGQCG